jgi:AcrR family transcriptional regulator
MARKPALVGTDRRQQILEAALDVFAEQGLEGATTKEIAVRAGVTPGLIYFYFPGKEELFFAAFEHQARQAFGQLDLSEEATSDEPPERVMRRVVSRFVQVMDSPRSASLMRILMRESVHCESATVSPSDKCEAREQIKRLSARLSANLHDYLAARMARGKLRALEPELVAQILTGAMVMVMLRRVSGDAMLARLSQEELTDTIVSLFLHGLLPTCPDQAAPVGTSG